VKTRPIRDSDRILTCDLYSMNSFQLPKISRRSARHDNLRAAAARVAGATRRCYQANQRAEFRRIFRAFLTLKGLLRTPQGEMIAITGSIRRPW